MWLFDDAQFPRFHSEYHILNNILELKGSYKQVDIGSQVRERWNLYLLYVPWQFVGVGKVASNEMNGLPQR